MEKIIFAYFVFINIVAFIVYGIDKLLAKSSKRRVSENKLHTLALLGGFFGATLSMYLFKNKVRKSPFLTRHIEIIFLWVVALVYYFFDFHTLTFIRSSLF